MIFFDTETCGLHGPTVLIQYQRDNGPIMLHSVWTEQIIDTLALIESFCDDPDGVVGFNLAFDWFHLCQTYTTLKALAYKVGWNAYPTDHIAKYAECEPLARDGECLKPKSALDLMLHARKGPYQSTMDRKDIYIKRVPAVLAQPLANELEKRVQLDEVYFARQKVKKDKHWEVENIKMADGTYNPDFKQIVLRFAPSAALKVLVAAIKKEQGKYEEVIKFRDVDVERKFRPIEAGWAPYALAISSKELNWRAEVGTKKGKAWPAVIDEHIAHWGYNPGARKYAEKDVEYTRFLYEHFGCPPLGDDDSVLACCVGAVRWRGYKIDIEKIKNLKKQYLEQGAKAPKAPKKVFEYIKPFLNEIEIAILRESTKKATLEKIASWEDHPAAIKAKECLDARKATKKVEVLNKLLMAGRFHASFKIIGALSSRMSGADGLNAQGIDKLKIIRECFPLSWDDLVLCGGDFASFEVSIADAVFNDPKLRAQLCKCSVCKYVCTVEEFILENCPSCGSNNDDARQKIHGLFGMALKSHENWTYDQVVATKKTEDDWYDKGKRGVFAVFYGGNWATLVERLGVTEDVAKLAEANFKTEYEQIGVSFKKIEYDFGPLKQTQIGKAVSWHEPKEYVESLSGFRRYFTVEFMLSKALYTIANKPPPSWRAMKIKCNRREDRGPQTVGGAVMSACFAAAFAIQSAVIRAANNHRIQSTGATETKRLQRKIWEVQPQGVHEWHVMPMNVHDEIMTPAKQHLVPVIRNIVTKHVEEARNIIPLVKIDWSDKLNSWADK